jgi:hypothetical protein
MSKTARRSSGKAREVTRMPVTRMPFEEFSVKDIDHLVSELDKSKPDGAVVDVSAMEDSHHSPCMQEMQAIVVQSVGPDGQPVHTYSMYQYCPVCKLAVRVL